MNLNKDLTPKERLQIFEEFYIEKKTMVDISKKYKTAIYITTAIIRKEAMQKALRLQIFRREQKGEILTEILKDYKIKNN